MKTKMTPLLPERVYKTYEAEIAGRFSRHGPFPMEVSHKPGEATILLEIMLKGRAPNDHTLINCTVPLGDLIPFVEDYASATSGLRRELEALEARKKEIEAELSGKAKANSILGAK